MSGREALVAGLGAARRAAPIVACIWVVDLVVAAVAAAPFARAIDRIMAGRTDGGALAARLDERLFLDLVAHHQELYGRAELRLVVVTAVGVFLHALVAGGLLETLHPRAAAPPTVRGFLSGCAGYAGRMLAVSVLAAALLALAGGALHGLLAPRLDEVARDLGRERMRLIVRLVPGASFLVVLAGVGLVADAWRAWIVVGGAPFGRSLGGALGFVRRRLAALLVVLAGGLVLGAAGVAAFALLDGAVPQGRWPAIVCVILAGQALMLWRHGVRVAVIAAEARLCDEAAHPGAYADDDLAKWDAAAGGDAPPPPAPAGARPPRLAGPGDAC